MSRPISERQSSYDDVTTVALTALTAAAAGGMARLVTGPGFLRAAVLAAVAAHALAWACRRLGLPLSLSALVSLGGLAVMVAWTEFPDTTAYLLPTGETWRMATAALEAAWRQFGDVIAPAPAIPGFVVATMVGAWWSAFVADWAAFRQRAGFEATVPATTLFVFASALGADRWRLPASAIFVTAALGFLLVHRAGERSVATAWFASRRTGGMRSLARGGTAIAAVAIVAALVSAPLLPGAGAEELLSWRDDGEAGPGSRTTVSPLVEIRGRLVSQSDAVLFTVRSKVRAYWRLTSLENFNGEIWSSTGSYAKAGDELGDRLDANIPVRSVVQEFRIEALASIWLPAAFRAVRVRGAGDVRHDPDSSSLLTEADTSDGLVYRVQSELPRPRTVDLSGAAPVDGPPEYLELPEGFSPRVRALAFRLTTKEGRLLPPYQRALALQDHLRSFTYDLDVVDAHSTDALESFLFDTKRGYCEQFAASYAAMARAVGLPARVAVGFTPGKRHGETWVVTGKNAHAWPEVLIEGQGWVAFEPTPGRSVPGGEAYTGVPAQDLSEGQAPAVVAPAPTAPPQQATATTTPRQREERTAEDTGPLAPLEARPSPWPRRVLTAAGVLLGLALVWVIGLPALVEVRRMRRRSAAEGSTVARVHVAWLEALEALSRAGRGPKPSETPVEYAQRVADPDLGALAADVTAAAYSDGAVADAVAGRAEHASDAVRAAVAASQTRRERLLRALDPRPLLTGGRPDRRQTRVTRGDDQITAA